MPIMESSNVISQHRLRLQRISPHWDDILRLTGSLLLGLVVNMIYMEAALNQLRLEGHQIYEADVARLSPLIHDHINMLGRYSFAMPETVARGELRPLRNPIVDQE